MDTFTQCLSLLAENETLWEKLTKSVPPVERQTQGLSAGFQVAKFKLVENPIPRPFHYPVSDGKPGSTSDIMSTQVDKG